MEILADHCVPPSLVRALRKQGLKITLAREAGLAKMPDEAIFNFALQNSLALFTFDHNFGDTTRFDIKNSAGVIIIYIERMSKREIFEKAIDFFSQTEPSRLKGHLFIIEPGRTRVWPK